ncbi:biotin-dependent carboxyltransferase family protein [Falsirhodobacter algicola]|uniref:5-oxoprolinase/urea amidolyase family protein n=1 Tax=Falsirhodobacter algicola TaxID=2692330 RepID=A0A8J8MVK1_9RHOB|nr:biotin-dependent carboxyltransferase family protein [Falsirhodobacter algicola]QUS37314.1 5-oxoprolinase/urea amidolyase family protein [Falsirhodobacter algicola]
MIEILRPAPLMTVQDRGRIGLRHAGVSPSGPMDAPALALANALVGNDPGAAGVEFAIGGAVLQAHAACRIAVTGGTFPLRIGGEARAPNQSHRVMAGQRIEIGIGGDAAWGYLGVSGGVDAPVVMGARAMHLRSGLGAPLAAGDELPLGPQVPGRTLAPFRPLPGRGEGPIRVVLGPQADSFSAEVIAHFLSQPFTVSHERDRMAMLLDGPSLPAAKGHDIVSDGTVAGSVQVPGSGRPLVLMAEGQTTGGYPKIATVIGADLPRLAQVPTGRAVRFHAVPRAMAEALWVAHLDALARTLHPLKVTIARRG